MEFVAYNPQTGIQINAADLRSLCEAVLRRLRRWSEGPWFIAGGVIVYSSSELVRFAPLETGAEWIYRPLSELKLGLQG